MAHHLFFFKQKTAYEISACLVGSEMCIRDRPYLAGGGTVRDDGLQGYGFRPDAPYAKKEIFRALSEGTREEREAAPLFICDRVETPSPACESRFDLGNKAQASYRFKRTYLDNWETIDRQVKDKIRNFRAAARTRFN